MELTHGGDVAGFEREYGFSPLDFSANISPLGLPNEVRQACIGALDRVCDYPDPLCRGLKEAIAAHDEVDERFVLCGNGSADLLFRLGAALRPAAAVVPAPTFAEYEQAISAFGGNIRRYALDRKRGYAMDEGFLECVGEDTEIAFICQPNNPTGLACEPEFVASILSRCEDVGAYLLVDECFVGLLDEPSRHSVTNLVGQHPKLVVMKAFTKLYGMPGLRLGYMLCSDTELIERMCRVSQPWAVSNLAQAAGIAALGCLDYTERTRRLVQEERAFLTEELATRGIDAQGQANFLFFEINDGGTLTASMRDRGILIRDCGNYAGLEPGAYRVAVRTHADNLHLLAALDKCLQAS